MAAAFVAAARRWLCVGFLASMLGPAAAQAHDAHAQHRAGPATATQRSARIYRVPDVTLLDMNGAAVALAEVLRTEVPVLVNFIFTTCTSVCPVMSATFAEVQRQLIAHGTRARLVSISIDPEQDTPDRLREFARKHGAAPGWQFLTGTTADVVAVQRALGAYRGNKMSHVPAAYVRLPGNDHWIRFDGLTGAAELVAEVRRATDK
jgi:protein SCO1/2